MSSYGYSVYETGKSLASGAGQLALNNDGTYSLTFTPMGSLNAASFVGSYSTVSEKIHNVQVSITGLTPPDATENQSLTDITLSQSSIGGVGALTGCFSIVLNGTNITGLFVGFGL